jgi:hypothetical protein
VGAVEQTPIALTLSDRSLPLIAAKCGPTVARRASHVRFLSNSSQLFRPVCIGGRRSTSGREQIGTPNLVLVQALGLRLANAPTRIPRLGNWSRRVASPLLRHRSSPLANSRSVQPRNLGSGFREAKVIGSQNREQALSAGCDPRVGGGVMSGVSGKAGVGLRRP